VRTHRPDDEDAQSADGLPEERQEIEREQIGGVEIFEEPRDGLRHSSERLDDLLP
jgi:hypothetical protein